MTTINNFLKERGLKKAFNRYKKIKYKKTEIINLDGRKTKILIYKKNNKTIIADHRTLKTMVTTKKYNLSNYKKALQTNLVPTKDGFRRERNLKFNFLYTDRMKNVEINRYEKPRRGKVGKVFVSITAHKGKRSKTVEGGSRKTRLLTIAKEREVATQEAINGALSRLPFYGDNYTVNWVNFVYYRSIQ